MTNDQKGYVWIAVGVVLFAAAFIGWRTNATQRDFYDVDARVGIVCEDGTRSSEAYLSSCDGHGGMKAFTNRVPLESGGTTEMDVTAPPWTQHGGFGELFSDAPWVWLLGAAGAFVMADRMRRAT